MFINVKITTNLSCSKMLKLQQIYPVHECKNTNTSVVGILTFKSRISDYTVLDITQIIAEPKMVILDLFGYISIQILIITQLDS